MALQPRQPPLQMKGFPTGYPYQYVAPKPVKVVEKEVTEGLAWVRSLLSRRGMAEEILARDYPTKSDRRESMDRVEMFPNKRGKWQWRIRSSNRRILATSEEYSTKHNCKQVVKSFCLRNPTLRIVDEKAHLPGAF